MKIPLKDASGKEVKKVDVKDSLFGLLITPALRGVIHQAVVRQQANARRGTAATKSRGQVAGSTRKLFIQKGTGRARAGSIRSPIRRGGGVAFGPHPRSYDKKMPKKMRRLALKGVLSAKLADDRLVVVDDLDIKEPRTRDMVLRLNALGATSSALVVTPEPQESVIKSARNLDRVTTLPAPYLNVVDLLRHDLVVMELGAVRKAEEIWAPDADGPSVAEAEAPAAEIEAPPADETSKPVEAEAEAPSESVDEEKPKKRATTRRKRTPKPKAEPEEK
jgi:large subunit ribosomal protein L4